MIIDVQVHLLLSQDEYVNDAMQYMPIIHNRHVVYTISSLFVAISIHDALRPLSI